LAAGCTTSSSFMMVAPSLLMVTRPWGRGDGGGLRVAWGRPQPRRCRWHGSPGISHRVWASCRFVSSARGLPAPWILPAATDGAARPPRAAAATARPPFCERAPITPRPCTCGPAPSASVLCPRTLSSWMSLSMPRGPRVVRTVSVSAMQALMLLRGGNGGRRRGRAAKAWRAFGGWDAAAARGAPANRATAAVAPRGTDWWSIAAAQNAMPRWGVGQVSGLL
jgi:hypothetical protein